MGCIPHRRKGRLDNSHVCRITFSLKAPDVVRHVTCANGGLAVHVHVSGRDNDMKTFLECAYNTSLFPNRSQTASTTKLRDCHLPQNLCQLTLTNSLLTRPILRAGMVVATRVTAMRDKVHLWDPVEVPDLYMADGCAFVDARPPAI